MAHREQSWWAFSYPPDYLLKKRPCFPTVFPKFEFDLQNFIRHIGLPPTKGLFFFRLFSDNLINTNHFYLKKNDYGCYLYTYFHNWDMWY